jgi:2-methylisocitrate lyase-like PEP mutase family enzyme
MASNYQTFKQLHHSDRLLVLPNAWDAYSASLLEKHPFPAVATSSAAVAQALGYADGENMPFTDYLFVVGRIADSIQVPLSVDIEMGYGSSAAAIAENIRRLTDLGVVGINIEDSVFVGSRRVLKDASSFARMLDEVRNLLWSKELFINVRCDTYILNVDGRREETRRRLPLYESAGADGIFLPCIAEEEDILDAMGHTRLPLNVMYIPGLAGVDELQRLGVRRLSLGPAVFSEAYRQVGVFTNQLFTNKKTTV